MASWSGREHLEFLDGLCFHVLREQDANDLQQPLDAVEGNFEFRKKEGCSIACIGVVDARIRRMPRKV